MSTKSSGRTIETAGQSSETEGVTRAAVDVLSRATVVCRRCGGPIPAEWMAEQATQMDEMEQRIATLEDESREHQDTAEEAPGEDVSTAAAGADAQDGQHQDVTGGEDGTETDDGDDRTRTLADLLDRESGANEDGDRNE